MAITGNLLLNKSDQENVKNTLRHRKGVYPGSLVGLGRIYLPGGKFVIVVGY